MSSTSSPSRPPAIRLERLRKTFNGPDGPITVVDDVDLSIPEGAFVSLLGSSGCGKTTTLRLIAGLEQADAGRILFRGDDITDAPASHRDMRMMFQDYALFPNLNVADNVAFGLRLKRNRSRFGPSDVARLVAEHLALVHLEDFAGRMPHELSGGQRQRVALARALVTDPSIVLFDEPLGALDAGLRRTMQYELKRIHTSFNKTFVYVTHDQEEAMAMSDLVAVMKGGRILQLASPEELYRRPNSRYVAEFIGSGNTLLDGSVADADATSIKIALPSGLTVVAARDDAAASVGDQVSLLLRADSVELVPEPDQLGENQFSVEVLEHVFLGGRVEYLMRFSNGAGPELTASAGSSAGAAVPNGAKATVRIDPRDIRVLVA